MPVQEGPEHAAGRIAETAAPGIGEIEIAAGGEKKIVAAREASKSAATSRDIVLVLFRSL